MRRLRHQLNKPGQPYVDLLDPHPTLTPNPLSNPKCQSKSHRLFSLKNTRKNRVIFQGEIQDFAEIRVDHDNYNSIMFMTEDQTIHFLHNKKMYREQNQREIEEYTYNKNAKKAVRMEETVAPFEYCQYCKSSFVNYHDHIRSRQHQLCKSMRFDHQKLKLLSFIPSIPIPKQTILSIHNLSDEDHVAKYSQKQSQIQEELRTAIQAFKMISRMMANLGEGL